MFGQPQPQQQTQLERVSGEREGPAGGSVGRQTDRQITGKDRLERDRDVEEIDRGEGQRYREIDRHKKRQRDRAVNKRKPGSLASNK
jgi:hypothetical protein